MKSETRNIFIGIVIVLLLGIGIFLSMPQSFYEDIDGDKYTFYQGFDDNLVYPCSNNYFQSPDGFSLDYEASNRPLWKFYACSTNYSDDTLGIKTPYNNSGMYVMSVNDNYLNGEHITLIKNVNNLSNHIVDFYYSKPITDMSIKSYLVFKGDYGTSQIELNSVTNYNHIIENIPNNTTSIEFDILPSSQSTLTFTLDEFRIYPNMTFFPTTYYRFENNKCNEIELFEENKTENDYLNLTDCQSHITSSGGGSSAYYDIECFDNDDCEVGEICEINECVDDGIEENVTIIEPNKLDEVIEKAKDIPYYYLIVLGLLLTGLGYWNIKRLWDYK